MKLFAFRGKAFASLWRRFAATVPASFDLCPIDVPDELDDVVYGESRYWQLMRWLVEQRVRCVEENMGQVIATSGCDSMFYGDCVPNILTQLDTCDFVAANDSPYADTIRLCACLQAMRCTPAVLAYKKRIASLAGASSDDSIMNDHRAMVKWAALPRDRYWSLGYRGWSPGAPVYPPKYMLWFHANWVLGVENKLALLQAVRDVVNPI